MLPPDNIIMVYCLINVEALIIVRNFQKIFPYNQTVTEVSGQLTHEHKQIPHAPAESYTDP